MKKVVILILFSFCIIITGCNKKEETNDTGKLYSFTLKEIEDNYLNRGFVNNVDKILLENKYPSKVKEAKEKTEDYINFIKNNYDEETIQENLLNAGDYANLEEYKNSYYLNIMQQFFILDYAKKQISNAEMNNYYNNKIIGDIEISFILISYGTNNEEKELAKNKVKKIMSELDRSNNLKTDFAKLAKEYSEDKETALKGGYGGFINYGTYSNDEIISQAEILENNNYSYFEGEYGYFFIYKMSQKEKSKIEEVEDKIREKLAEELLSNNANIQIEALNTLREELGNKELFINLDTNDIYDISGNSIYKTCINKKCETKDYKQIDLSKYEKIKANQKNVYQNEKYKYLDAPIRACSDRTLDQVIKAYNSLNNFNFELIEINNAYILKINVTNDENKTITAYGVLALDNEKVYVSNVFSKTTESEDLRETSTKVVEEMLCP